MSFDEVFDATWSETDHPRAENGQFGAGGGGKSPALKPGELKKVGKQMGSNPGGVFEDSEGKKFYVKKGQSKAHVRNELLAASMYSLAGSPTLQYRDVEGGEHIATEMSKLDKGRATEFTPEEKREAQMDFMTHAWLANWDAVGTGSDNLGTIGGKPVALDLGGALAYRAQGAPKGKAFGNSVSEIDTMRNPSMSPDAAAIFKSMTPEQLRESAKKVTDISDEQIRAKVQEIGEGEEMADKLIARKNDIAKRFGGAKDETGTEEVEEGLAPPMDERAEELDVTWDRARTRAVDWAGNVEYYTSESLGPRRERTPEGFLVCYEVPAARVGEMIYGPGEVPSELGVGRDGRIRVVRSAAEVFSPKSMASLNGKAVTDDHPPVDVDPKNWKYYTKGFVMNPRRGTGDFRDFVVVDLIIYDEETIADIMTGKREVSCGYNPDYLQLLDDNQEPILGRGEQVNIIYNHLALVKAGRCGPACAIGDRKTIDASANSTDDFFTPERAYRLERLARRFN